MILVMRVWIWSCAAPTYCFTNGYLQAKRHNKQKYTRQSALSKQQVQEAKYCNLWILFLIPLCQQKHFGNDAQQHSNMAYP